MNIDNDDLLLPSLANKKPVLERRDVLKMGLIGMLGAVTPIIGAGEALAGRRNRERRVFFHSAHTNQTFNGVYRIGNYYVPEAFERINYIFRDHRTQEVFPMDPRVIDILSVVQAKARKRNTPLTILSGYRSPRTNAMLGKTTAGVAKNSFHMYGQAVDIRMSGYSAAKIRHTARSLRAGGVGYYPKSNFVHVDTGDVRSWS